MLRTIPAVAALGAAVATLTLAATAPAGPVATKLNGTVGPGFTISLAQNGKKVKTLKAGTYAFTIADKATIHNFVLEEESPSHVEKTLTSVGFQGTKTVTLKLAKGKWKYYCAPHEATMKGFFTVM
jgi:plastocyanin